MNKEGAVGMRSVAMETDFLSGKEMGDGEAPTEIS